MRISIFMMILAFILVLFSCHDEERVELRLFKVDIGSTIISISNSSANTNVPVDKTIYASFSTSLNTSSAASSVILKKSDGTIVPLTFSFLDNDRTIAIQPAKNLDFNSSYELTFSSQLTGKANEFFNDVTVRFLTLPLELILKYINAGNINILSQTTAQNVPGNIILDLGFSLPLNPILLTADNIKITSVGGVTKSLVFELLDNNTILRISSTEKLDYLTKHTLWISTNLTSQNGEKFSGLTKYFYTAVDPTPKFPLISDDELLTLVQQQTLKYFWDFGHPASGMARERNTSGNTVTSGGTGFGLMAMIVGIQRGFITRQEGIQRLDKIITFLETADRFHGAWSHWIDGSTGKVIPFSTKDNGGDLVETSFLVQGLITFRQYLNATDLIEKSLIDRINVLWEGVEWDWYRKNNENVLYWHWSPNYNWDMNFQLSGYFEEQITYFLAAASPTHSIPKTVYSNGFGQNGGIVRNNTYYGINLPLGGLFPLFFVHYSYLGLDPHFTDDYTNYWTQNVNASKINYAYCVANPRSYVGYSSDCWGLTASDNQIGYNAHSPGNDLGVITPTAALSSFPYTPVESMQALKFFYYNLGDKLWGPYGFYDSFNITQAWYASSYLAIDQGPIIVMIENHRTKLLWNLFMSAPEVQSAVTKLNFRY